MTTAELIEKLERASKKRSGRTVYSVAEALRLKERDEHNAVITALKAKEADNDKSC